MTRQGKHSTFSSSKPSSLSSSPSPPSSRTSRHSTPPHSTSSTMDQHLEFIITKWDPESSSYAKVTSLFYENRSEAHDFLKAVKDLQISMDVLSSEVSASQSLGRAHNLMQIAMKRLQKEFYQILSDNRSILDPESSLSVGSSISSFRSTTPDFDDRSTEDEELQPAVESTSEVERADWITDLRLIAECMISAGYGKECIKIYKMVRKSIVDEGVYRLGIERLKSSQIQKMDWELLEGKIKSWLKAFQYAVKTIFMGEWILCNQVFSSDPVNESCISEICKDSALTLLNFPEFVAKCKHSPEKMFRILDLYSAISELMPEIESIFAYESTSAVPSLALNSLIKLGNSVRVMLSNFESAIQKDASKSAIPSGGIHPLTRYVMNYMSFLADYSGILADIVTDLPLQVRSSLPETISDESSFITEWIRWLLLVLLCKIDGKAEIYKDVSLSYLFLANNLQYIVEKVKNSNLRFLLGEEWISMHDSKVIQYARNFEKAAWSKVVSALPQNPTAAEISPQVAKECFRMFNSAFEEAYRTQSLWVVPDRRLRDDIKISVANKLVPVYSAFYGKFRALLRAENDGDGIVRFAPEDLGNYLSDLFYGNRVSGSSSSSSRSLA